MTIKSMAGLGLLAALALAVTLALPAKSVGSGATCINKELCAQMLKMGDEAFNRGKYRLAMDYFRKAVMADSGSKKAWSKYDLASLYAIAQAYRYAVERGGRMALPGIKPQAAQPGPAAQPAAKPAAKPAPAPAPAGALPKIPEDEGC